MLKFHLQKIHQGNLSCMLHYASKLLLINPSLANDLWQLVLSTSLNLVKSNLKKRLQVSLIQV